MMSTNGHDGEEKKPSSDSEESARPEPADGMTSTRPEPADGMKIRPRGEPKSQVEHRRRVDPREDPRHKDYINKMHGGGKSGDDRGDKKPEKPEDETN